MDWAGWVRVSDLLRMRFMGPKEKKGPYLDLEARVAIVELDNQMKIRFLLCEHEGVVYIRAAQAQRAA
eukprot:401649-Alexandrium_andersonii.AAC.1